MKYNIMVNPEELKILDTGEVKELRMLVPQLMENVILIIKEMNREIEDLKKERKSWLKKELAKK